MPIYDYRCPKCNSTFEVTHGMKEHPTITCPTCKSVCTKVFSSPSISFKGSGFYNTDMRDNSSSTKH